jgi:hypothetical protein
MSDAAKPTDIPKTSGVLDLDYVAGALDRAGLPPVQGELSTEPLLGGRTGATVQRLVVGDRSYVLKFASGKGWKNSGMGYARAGEHRLWAEGVTRQLRGPIRCPVVDVTHEHSVDRFWILMNDVSAGIRGRGAFVRADSERLVAGLAAMQAPYFADPGELEDGPLPPVSGPTNLFRSAVLHLSGKQRSEAPWLLTMVEDFQVVGAFLPIFLDCLGARLADEYLTLVADESWVQAMDREPATLLHGDLRRANMAFCGESIDLFDWEFAARGPAGCDLQWHCMLHYWGYPPDGVEPGDDCDDLAALYVETLEAELGSPVDRAAFDRGWKLGWLKVMAQLGYVLADPLYPEAKDGDSERVGALCRRAVRRALDMRAALG